MSIIISRAMKNENTVFISKDALVRNTHLVADLVTTGNEQQTLLDSYLIIIITYSTSYPLKSSSLANTQHNIPQYQLVDCIHTITISSTQSCKHILACMIKRITIKLLHLVTST